MLSFRPPAMRTVNYFRTIWISDVHLGTRASRADFLYDFLRHNEADYLYLVGDIFDGWALQRNWYWDPSTTAYSSRSCARPARARTSSTFRATTTNLPASTTG
nr:hypothetical protein [Rhodothermus marinus]